MRCARQPGDRRKEERVETEFFLENLISFSELWEGHLAPMSRNRVFSANRQNHKR